MWPSTTKYFSPLFSYNVPPDGYLADPVLTYPIYADAGVKSKPRYSAASSGLANMIVRSSRWIIRP